MAKKRPITPLDNTAVSEDTYMNSELANIEYLTGKLKESASNANVDLEDILKKTFGFEGVGKANIWTLESGKQVKFTELNLTYEQVLKETTVTFSVNGRDQSLLTPESLRGLDTLLKQQFYPAIGRFVDGKIDVLDGSRRRQRFLLEQGKIAEFKLLVTYDEISKLDAQKLAKAIQSAKEHTLRESGLMLMDALQTDESLSQRDLADMFELSLSKVNRSLTAARVDHSLLKLFPVINDLTYSDYKILDQVQNKSKNDLLLLVELATDEINCLEAQPLDEMKVSILDIIKNISASLTETHRKKVKEFITIKKFEKKHMYARKKASGRKYIYEFSKIPSEVQEKIDFAIKEILDTIE